jgi:hypothetical protein
MDDTDVFLGNPEDQFYFNCNSSVGDGSIAPNAHNSKLTPAVAFFNPRNNLKAI